MCRRKFLPLLCLFLVCALPARSQQLIARVGAGRTAPITDSKGQVWQPDTTYVSGNSRVSTSCPAETALGPLGSPDTAFYKTARVGTAPNPEMVYTFKNLAAGNYTVNLYLDDCSSDSANTRKFTVQANGVAQLSNFDILANTPKNTPIKKTFNVTVSTGQLALTFVHGVDNPIVSGIELFFVPAVDTNPPTISITVPSAAMTLSAPTPITAHATDNVGIRSISATLDGTALTTSGTSTGPDYTFTSDLATLKAGAHTVVAIATDTSGNTSTATVSFQIAVTVSVSITATPKPHSVSLTWNAVGNAASYNVYRRLSTGSFGLLANSKTAAYSDTAVTNSGNYSYAVTTVAADGTESVKSAEVAVTIPVS